LGVNELFRADNERTTREAERVIQDVAANYDRSRLGASVLAPITSFVGAGGPRFWFSVPPAAPAPNYAQLLVQFTHSEDTNNLVGPLQEAVLRQNFILFQITSSWSHVTSFNNVTSGFASY
jgi:hypothetical protein